jgi:NADPH:quinone reductase-like Zn-dependent oxidoreductase
VTEDKYRRVVISRHGGPEVLEVVDEDLPTPAAGQIRVRTLASGVSAHDVMLRSAGFPGFPKPPFTPGVDVVGVVDAIGDGVSTVEMGQTVAALLPAEGGYAEAVCVPAEDAVAVPEGVDPAEAVCVPAEDAVAVSEGVDPAEAVCVVANYITAYAMLHRGAEVRSRELVLVHGAAGGVGSALLDLGRLAGLEMYGTASQRNHELVKSFGATPMDYRNEDFVERIRELTGDGVDVVFDQIGGARQLWRSYRALRKGGRLIWFGVAATSRSGMSVIPASLVTRFLLSLIPDGKRAPMPPDSGKPKNLYRETLAMLLDHLAAGKIEPVIAARIPLVEAVRAHELLERGSYAGKVVLIANT